MKKYYKFGDIADYIYLGEYGIFKSLSDSVTYPKVSFLNDLNVLMLDTEYLAMNTHEKLLAPFLNQRWELAIERGTEQSVAQNMMPFIANLVYNHFGDKWKRFYDMYVTMQYNPIENYNSNETESFKHITDETTTHNVIDGTNIQTNNLSESNTQSNNQTITNQKMAFNSNSYVDDTKQSNIGSGTNSTTNTGTITNDNDVTDDTTTSHEFETSRTMQRSGNIGVTTTAQMMEGEFELRKRDLIKIMFDDIDSLICLKIY